MSESIRSVIQDAVNRKRMPAFNPGSLRDLALKLGMSVPVSLLDLPKTLNELLPAGVTYDSGRFASGNVHASATLYLQSDGGMSFSGQVHESGVVGDNFVLAMALLDVKDASGNTLVFVHQDTIVGQLNVGFSEKEWHEPGFNQLVKDNWDAIKHTRVETQLHVSTDPLQLIETVIAGWYAAKLLVTGVVIVVISATKACPEGSHWECRPVVGGSPPNQSGGVSVDVICRCEFN
jgi:hypothetical protein